MSKKLMAVLSMMVIVCMLFTACSTPGSTPAKEPDKPATTPSTTDQPSESTGTETPAEPAGSKVLTFSLTGEPPSLDPHDGVETTQNGGMVSL